MTSKNIPKTCDFCGEDIVSEMKYKLQLSQRGGSKGKFVKCNNDMDMCHPCFKKSTDKGFKPAWVTLVKDDNTGKWSELDPQEQIG